MLLPLYVKISHYLQQCSVFLLTCQLYSKNTTHEAKATHCCNNEPLNLFCMKHTTQSAIHMYIFFLFVTFWNATKFPHGRYPSLLGSTDISQSEWTPISSVYQLMLGKHVHIHNARTTTSTTSLLSTLQPKTVYVFLYGLWRQCRHGDPLGSSEQRLIVWATQSPCEKKVGHGPCRNTITTRQNTSEESCYYKWKPVCQGFTCDTMKMSKDQEYSPKPFP